MASISKRSQHATEQRDREIAAYLDGAIGER